MRRTSQIALSCVAIFSLLLPAASATSKAPVTYMIKTSDKVAFITIDDGYTPNQAARDFIIEKNIPITLFLIADVWSNSRLRKFYRPLLEAGALVGNHTKSHTQLTTAHGGAAKRAICEGAAIDAKQTGTRPVWLRPPYGSFDQRTQELATACGMERLIMWDVSADGKRFSTWGGPVKKGDIILMHWNANSLQTLKLILRKMKEQGLTPASLADYL